MAWGVPAHSRHKKLQKTPFRACVRAWCPGAQTKSDLRDVLKRPGKGSYTERLADFHLLLWLSKQPNLDPHDIALLCEAIKEGQPVMEGYRLIIDHIAGIQ